MINNNKIEWNYLIILLISFLLSMILSTLYLSKFKIK